MRKHWWKFLCVILLCYVIIAGFMFQFPALPQLNETIRNVFFHIPMWYAMIICFTVSAVYAVRFLIASNNGTQNFYSKSKYDIKSSVFANTGILFGCFGMITGMEWAQVAWGTPWNNDPKQIGAAICLMSYFAYWLLRINIKDEDKQARLAAVYNIFAFALMFPLVYIIPAHSKSLHPGTDGKPFEALYTQASSLRKVSLPAMVGWILMSVWISNLRIRIKILELKKLLRA